VRQSILKPPPAMIEIALGMGVLAAKPSATDAA